MADTKKPNFAAALKAQAKPAETDEDEKIIVDLGDGVPTPLYRGKGEKRMDDAAWARLQKRAVKPAVEKFSGDKLIVNNGTTRMTITRENQSDDEWKQVTEDTKRIHGKINVEEHYTPPENRGYGTEWGKGTIYPTKADYERLKGMPSGEEKNRALKELTEAAKATKSEDASAPPREASKTKEQAPAEAQDSTQQETSPVSSAGPGMSPRANMQAMAMGATPKQSNEDYIKEYQTSRMAPLPDIKGAATGALQSIAPMTGGFPAKFSGQGAPTGGFPGLAGDDAALAQANAKGEQNAASDMAAISAANDTVGAIGKAGLEMLPAVQTARQVGALGGDLVNNISTGNIPDVRDVFPNASALSGRVFNTDPMGTNSVLAPPAAQQPPVGTNSVLAPPGEGGGMGMSASVSSKTPGKGNYPAPPPDTYVADSQRRLKDTEAVNKLTLETQRKMAADEMEIRATEQVGRAEMEKAEVERQAAQEALTSKYVDGLQQLKQQVVEASKETVDPNRYWNNKSDGQKAMAVVAGALFGFTGQGMQWLQRLDGLVQNDMQAQAADLARKRGLLSDASGLQNNLVAQAEAKGLRGQAAYKAAVMAHKEDLASQIEMNARNYADPILQQKAMQASIDLRASASKDEAEYMRQHALDAANINKMHAEAEQSRAAAYAARVAANKPAKGEELDKLDPAALSRLEAIDKAIAAAKEARTAIKGGEGDNKLVDQVAKNWVQTLNSFGLEDIAKGAFPKTSGRMSAARQGQKTVLKGVMGEAINNEDIKDTAPMWGTPGFGSTTGWLDSQEEVLLAERNAIIENAKKAKRDVGALTKQGTSIKTFAPSRP